MNPLNPTFFELVYPTVEVIFGLLELFPSQAYYPLFLHFFRILNEISEKTHLQIPFLNFVFRLLKNKNFLKKFTEKNAKEFDFELNFKAAAEIMNNNKFWHDLLLELTNVVIKNLSINVNAPFFEHLSAFPLKTFKLLYKSKMMIEKKVILKRAVFLLDSFNFEGCQKNT